MTRALVTGGAGFIGSHVAEALLQTGHQVLVFDNLTTGARENLPSGADLALADITDVHATAATVRSFSPEIIVHLAAHTQIAASVADPARDAAVNVMGTLSVLQAGVSSRCRKFIFASSSTVYGDPLTQPVRESDPLRPISPYGGSKAAAEHYVRIVSELHRIPYTILRFGNVFGPRDSPRNHHVITSFVDALLSGEQPIIEWDGEQTKDYIYVGDVAAAVVAALEHGADDAFNISSETGISVRELLDLVCSVMDIRVAPRYRPRRAGDVRRFLMDCSKAHRLLGWRPRTAIVDALHMTVDARSREHPAREASSEPVVG